MARAVGIDLGTTNSVIAAMDRNGPMVIPNGLGERITPSVVGFAKSSEILIGKKAKRAAAINAGRTVTSIKRQMGSSHRVKIQGKEYTPQEISAMILQKLKQDAEDYFGEEVVDAVITVPAYFTDAQRQATKDAGEIAGFNVQRIIDEPTAAAIAYGLEKNKDQIIAVYDFGGGTFDVSIIEVTSGVFRVMAIQGDAQLGGDDFDTRIADYLFDQFKQEHDIDLSEDPVAMTRVRQAAEEAKIDLSQQEQTDIVLEAITMSDKGPLTLEANFTRKKLESLVEDLIQRTIEPMNNSVADAGIEPSQIGAVLLVGGMTRMPRVQQVVKDTLGIAPSRDISPDEVVALGSAVQALVVSPVEDSLKDTLAAHYNIDKPVIIHMTPFSLGVGLESDMFQAVIERNSTYPTEATDVFTTTRDFQETISFPIYEGEGTKASENTFLDLLRIEGISPAPRGVPRIEVTFKINPDRILEVQGEDLATGLEQRVVVDATASRLDEGDKNRMVKAARDRVTQQLRQKLADNAGDEAEDVIERASMLIQSMNGDPRAVELQKKVADLSGRLASGATADLQSITGDLVFMVSEIETSAG